MPFQITIDCASPDAQARFWAAALRYDLEGPPDGYDDWRAYWIDAGLTPEEAAEADGYDSIVDPAGRGPRIWFQQVPEAKAVKNRLHLDLLVGGGRRVPRDDRKRRVDGEVRRLQGLGAAIRIVMDEPAQNHYAIGMVDPEGNEFDVV